MTTTVWLWIIWNWPIQCLQFPPSWCMQLPLFFFFVHSFLHGLLMRESSPENVQLHLLVPPKQWKIYSVEVSLMFADPGAENISCFTIIHFLALSDYFMGGFLWWFLLLVKRLWADICFVILLMYVYLTKVWLIPVKYTSCTAKILIFIHSTFVAKNTLLFMCVFVYVCIVINLYYRQYWRCIV